MENDSSSKRWWRLVIGAIVAFALLLGTSALAIWATLDDPVVTRPKRPPTEWMLRNVNVVDVAAGTAIPARDILVRDGMIADITATSSVDFDGVVVDGTDKWVVPGLIDMHVHVMGASNPPWDLDLPQPEVNLSRLLYAGVTRVFDPGAPTPDVFELRDAVANGSVLGPRLYAAGPVFTGPDGHPAAMMRLAGPEWAVEPIVGSMTREVGSAAEGRREVAALAPWKPDFVKVAIDKIPLNAPQIQREVAGAVFAESTKQGIRPVAHIGTFDDAKQAAELGATAWIHGVYKEPITAEQAAELAAFEIPMVPTLAVFKSYTEIGTDARAPLPIEREMAPAELLDSFMVRPTDYEPHPDLLRMVEKLRAEKNTGIENLNLVHAAGVRILAGSDTQAGLIPGGALHRELRLYSQAGLEPAEILRTATLHPAEFLEQTDDPSFGLVEPGKVADLLVLRKNPLEGPENLAEIDFVVLGGVVLVRDSPRHAGGKVRDGWSG